MRTWFGTKREQETKKGEKMQKRYNGNKTSGDTKQVKKGAKTKIYKERNKKKIKDANIQASIQREKKIGSIRFWMPI